MSKVERPKDQILKPKKPSFTSEMRRFPESCDESEDRPGGQIPEAHDSDVSTKSLSKRENAKPRDK